MNEAETKVEEHPVPRQDPEFLTALAEKIIQQRVFTSAQVPNNMIGSVFMPIGLGAFHGRSKEWIMTVGLIYEEIEKAGPRSVNDMPMFMSLQIVHTEDMPFLIEKIEAFEKALAEVRTPQNVFEEIGIQNPEEHRQKADIVAKIQRAIEDKDLRLSEAASKIGIETDALTGIIRGSFGHIDISDLTTYLGVLE